MNDNRRLEDQSDLDAETSARRAFLKKVGKASATAPAVALLMAANLKAAKAQAVYGGGGSGSS